jgi:hypothetical protein
LKISKSYFRRLSNNYPSHQVDAGGHLLVVVEVRGGSAEYIGIVEEKKMNGSDNLA